MNVSKIKYLHHLCPICKRENSIQHSFLRDYRLKRVNYDISLIKCIKCEHVWQNPMPNEGDLFRFYDHNFYESKGVKFSQKDALISKLQFDGLSRSIKKLFGPNPIKILDYGSGQGQLMRYLRDLGHEIEGCEISESGRDISSYRYGFEIHEINQQFFLNNADKYDLVIMSHVLEHIPNPQACIDKIQKIIKRDGYLAIDVPNINSWEAKLYGGIYIHLDIPRHVHHYSKKSLSILMNNFYIVGRKLNGLYSIQFPISGLRSIQNYLIYKGKYNNLLKYILLLLIPLQLTFSLATNFLLSEKICVGGFFRKNK